MPTPETRAAAIEQAHELARSTAAAARDAVLYNDHANAGPQCAQNAAYLAAIAEKMQAAARDRADLDPITRAAVDAYAAQAIANAAMARRYCLDAMPQAIAREEARHADMQRRCTAAGLPTTHAGPTYAPEMRAALESLRAAPDGSTRPDLAYPVPAAILAIQ